MTMSITVWDGHGRKVGQVHPAEHGVGYRRCGLAVGAGGDRNLAMVQGLSAGLMEELANRQREMDAGDADGRRCLATAMTHLEIASMFALRGLGREG